MEKILQLAKERVDLAKALVRASDKPNKAAKANKQAEADGSDGATGEATAA